MQQGARGCRQEIPLSRLDPLSVMTIGILRPFPLHRKIIRPHHGPHTTQLNYLRLANMLTCRAEPDILGKLKDKTYLDLAAKRYLLALKSGLTEEDAFEYEFKGSSLADAYKEKLKGKLEARAMELKQEEEERLERESKNYRAGKEAYECGEYMAATRLFQQGIEDAGPDSLTGGDARLWLALSLHALGREEEAVEICRQLEETHPSRKIKKQAFEIRYILEAPKLPPEPGETVVIPTIKSDTWRKDARSKKPIKQKKVESSSYWDRANWDFSGGSSEGDPEGAKWYVPVAWAAVIAVCVFGNTALKAGLM